MNQGGRKLQLLCIFFMDNLAILLSCFIVGYFLKMNWKGEPENWLFLTLIILAYIVFSFFKDTISDFFERGFFAELTAVCYVYAFLFAICVLVCLLFFRQENYNRFYWIIWFLSGAALMLLFRNIYKWYLTTVYRNSNRSRRLAIITTMDRAEEVVKNFQKKKMWYCQITGLIVIDAKKEEIGALIENVPICADYKEMYPYALEGELDEVFIEIPDCSEIPLAEVIEKLEGMGVIVNLSLQVYKMPLKTKKRELKKLGNQYAVSFSPMDLNTGMLILKRCIDILGGLVGVAITLVLSLVIAPFLLAESPGPLFFSQTRVGKNGRRFKIYKFRSMYMDAEERKKELMKLNKMDGLMFKMDNDPRITKVGQFLRKTSIDEFPQFWNVLKGDMSLVGTRPPTLDEFLQYEGHYKRRLSLVPGITGLWQVSGRSNITSFEEIVNLDLQYIDNWSILLDLRILLKTVGVVLLGRGAE